MRSAAATLGAPPLAVFFLVTLPLAAPGLIAGAVLGFAKALGEFGATITFVSNIPGETRTIPAEIYVLTQTPGGDGAALAMSIVSACARHRRAGRLRTAVAPDAAAPAKRRCDGAR